MRREIDGHVPESLSLRFERRQIVRCEVGGVLKLRSRGSCERPTKAHLHDRCHARHADEDAATVAGKICAARRQAINSDCAIRFELR